MLDLAELIPNCLTPGAAMRLSARPHPRRLLGIARMALSATLAMGQLGAAENPDDASIKDQMEHAPSTLVLNGKEVKLSVIYDSTTIEVRSSPAVLIPGNYHLQEVARSITVSLLIDHNEAELAHVSATGLWLADSTTDGHPTVVSDHPTVKLVTELAAIDPVKYRQGAVILGVRDDVGNVHFVRVQAQFTRTKPPHS
jgi:hypothetical protein